MDTRITKLLLVVAAFQGIHAQCQDWFPSGATWHYHYGDVSGSVGYVAMEVVGDTVVAGSVAHSIHRVRETYNYPMASYDSFTMPPLVAREALGLVELFIPGLNAFDTFTT